ncbi:RagB/SusD family nutrient uptake outer membrane protein [Sunxiuqinia elliptica]|uniref:Putative outer membrane starch-binding protein n=1 Tax=Sunxiuqinia elliptica TaxID=655355 RepID=A0A4R6HCB2_9BACT|nr:RagB/SusD family nutrient uptake outer membrane protein [Sunxiuqinia elliptica]TDO05416.1 putative outer membrane starch-binding protein [Sunxiuqinia elliptica]TDO64963.1 putative outer membrane starch-binding protein [Sunxiuqinia elliptica]
MKKYLLFVFVLVLVSCKDFLVLEPENQISENVFYKTEADFETAMIGMYGELQTLHDISNLFLTEVTTDNMRITNQLSNPPADRVEIDEVNLTSTNGFVNTIWGSCYKTIARSNNILSRIDDADFDESKKSQFKGESLFLRAYTYFYLVRLFGDVPIVKVAFRSPGEVADYDMGRKPVSEVYKLILDDLQESAGLLNAGTGLSKSRASLGAVKTLQGKVYLTQKEYALAATVLLEVQQMNLYTLSTDYGQLFSVGNDELPESIFEIKYLTGNVGEGNSLTTNFSYGHTIVPTLDMIQAYEVDDLRKDASLADSLLAADGNYATYEEKYIRKFYDPTAELQFDGGINVLPLRYADVLLMYAEALNETGKTTEAHDFLNMVRDRAGLGSLSGLSKPEFALALERERRVEFLAEGHRWFDLVRTGRAQEIINNYYISQGLSFRVEDYELLMPIPQSERDIDPDLSQNTGY